MGEFTSYDPGTPLWVDVSAPDVDQAVAFYCGLFGWTHEASGPVEETGGYGMFFLNGKVVAGIGPHPPDNPAPPSWSTYIATADAAATCELITGAGGTVMVEPMAVMDAGTMAFALDPSGAHFGLWQPGQHTGAQLANEVNTFSWNELNTRDVAAAAAFYATVFGWEARHAPDGSYTEWLLGGQSIGGCMDMTGKVPEEVPPHWLTYFRVADCDAAVKQATELGGTQLLPAMDIEPGRFSLVADPAGGAHFAVIQFAEDRDLSG